MVDGGDGGRRCTSLLGVAAVDECHKSVDCSTTARCARVIKSKKRHIFRHVLVVRSVGRGKWTYLCNGAAEQCLICDCVSELRKDDTCNK